MILKVENLYKFFGGLAAVNDVSLQVGEREIVGLIGPNGSGKTTLLKCLCRLLEPVGAIYVDGENLSKIDPSALARKISYLSSEVESSIDGLTVFDLVSSGRTPFMRGYWWESREDEKIVLESIKIMGLEDKTDRKIEELSSGEKQRARIARLLSQTPKIFLIDEPTVHLDLKHQIDIMNILKNLTLQKKIVIAVLHDLNLASVYADRIIVLKKGEIAAVGRPVELLTEALLRDVYDVNVRVIHTETDNSLIVVPILDV